MKLICRCWRWWWCCPCRCHWCQRSSKRVHNFRPRLLLLLFLSSLLCITSSWCRMCHLPSVCMFACERVCACAATIRNKKNFTNFHSNNHLNNWIVLDEIGTDIAAPMAIIFRNVGRNIWIKSIPLKWKPFRFIFIFFFFLCAVCCLFFSHFDICVNLQFAMKKILYLALAPPLCWRSSNGIAAAAAAAGCLRALCDCSQIENFNPILRLMYN